jgi:hypothetical protein
MSLSSIEVWPQTVHVVRQWEGASSERSSAMSRPAIEQERLTRRASRAAQRMAALMVCSGAAMLLVQCASSAARASRDSRRS